MLPEIADYVSILYQFHFLYNDHPINLLEMRVLYYVQQLLVIIHEGVLRIRVLILLYYNTYEPILFLFLKILFHMFLQQIY